MPSSEIRKRFLDFFAKRGHAIVPSASLIPENDASVLFMTAGMQPLVPYLLGQSHLKGRRLVNIQRCVRTGDIDEVGDSRHLTFFEMLGNWSLGDYFKKEAIAWSYELLTSKEEGFGLDPERLYISIFEGNDDAPKDTESIEIWKSVGIPINRIFPLGVGDNWWGPGESGPCGPDTEMFYDLKPQEGAITSREEFIQAQDTGRVVEIWNDVFMEYEKKDGKVIGKLKQKNVDTGAGLERVAAVLQNKDNIFETDLFMPLIESIRRDATVHNEKAERIVADHIRAAAFIAAEGVQPSNTDRGYVLRRLIRRAVYYASQLGIQIDVNMFKNIENTIFDVYADHFSYAIDLPSERETAAIGAIDEEVDRFQKTLERGLKEFEKLANSNISGSDAFNLYQTYGFPLELTLELAEVRGITVDTQEFQKKLKEHQELSRKRAEQKFKGGLGDTSEMSVKYHTATHLLNAALREVLGDHVKQRGSNITPERLRFDFSHPQKLTDEEKQKVEDLVNQKIQEGLNVIRREMPREEAEKIGAQMEFGAKYPDIVSVYCIEDGQGNAWSREFCGGPHVENTRTLGHFKIIKEEAVSAGVRRIKAILT